MAAMKPHSLPQAEPMRGRRRNFTTLGTALGTAPMHCGTAAQRQCCTCFSLTSHTEQAKSCPDLRYQMFDDEPPTDAQYAFLATFKGGGHKSPTITHSDSSLASHNELAEALAPWTRILAWAGLHHALNGPPSHWATAHGVFSFLLFLFIGIFNYLGAASDPTFQNASNYAAAAYVLPSLVLIFASLMYAGCLAFIRSPERLRTVFAILFDGKQEGLLRTARLDFSIAVRSKYTRTIMWTAVISEILLLVINTFYLFGRHDEFHAFEFLVVGISLQYLYFCMLMCITIPILASRVHAAALLHLRRFVTEPAVMDVVMPELIAGSHNSQHETSIQDMNKIESGFVTDAMGAPLYLDALQFVLISIRRNRQHLQDSCLALFWTLTGTIGFLALVSMLYCALALAVFLLPNAQFDAWPLRLTIILNFSIFGAIFAANLFIVLFSIATVTDSYQMMLSALVGRGNPALMQTIKRHAWQLQLLTTTPEADYFRVSGIPITAELVARLGYLSVIVLGTLITQIGNRA